MLNPGRPRLGLASLLALTLAACGHNGTTEHPADGGASGSGQGGASGSGGLSGGSGGSVPSGGTTATGGAPSGGESGGAPDAAPAAGPDGGIGSYDAGMAPSDGSAPPSGTPNYGGVGEKPAVPIQYTATPVPPLVMPECPDDPTQGMTEYHDSFVIQRPYDLPAAARFGYMDGIYTFFVMSNDKAHEPGNGTAPRTEARYSNFATGEHLWSADVMLDSPLSRTCIMQIHNVDAAIAVYLRVIDGRMFNLATGQTILPDSYGKWFNLKVTLNTQTKQVRVFVNNCLKETSSAPGGGTPNWYFKNGVYTCDTGTCRDHYKNLHLYQRGSTDPSNTAGTTP
jgi:hypothetical protein